MSKLSDFTGCRLGQTAIEYSLIMALLSLVAGGLEAPVRSLFDDMKLISMKVESIGASVVVVRDCDALDPAQACAVDKRD